MHKEAMKTPGRQEWYERIYRERRQPFAHTAGQQDHERVVDAAVQVDLLHRRLAEVRVALQRPEDLGDPRGTLVDLVGQRVHDERGGGPADDRWQRFGAG